jgi:DNA mismatch repair protein MutL
MPAIHLLPEIIANQIAAGEVVQRPASVVKELLENAVDAGSQRITLIFKDAGRSLIQVIDDGHGMDEVDARMCFERHATSKIAEAEDLFNLHTLGFRGEAMASIAAVAQVVLTTRHMEEELGTKLYINGGEVVGQEVVATDSGSNIEVKNLFFNLPARRSFLKSNSVESKHIIDEFQRVALSQPGIAFALYGNDSKLYDLPATKLNHRIVHLFGKGHQSQLIACKVQTPQMTIDGYIGDPKRAKRTRGEQFFFVNGRYVRSAYLHHAVKKALQEVLPANAFPFYVLFITLPSDKVDVNVHPTKTEVKFEDASILYATLTTTVKKTISELHITPSIDFQTNTNDISMPTAYAYAAPKKAREHATSAERSYANFAAHSQKGPEITADGCIKLSSIINQPMQKLQTAKRVKMQLHCQYIIVQVKSGMLLIDQHAAHHRILFEEVKERQKKGSNATQQLLFPITVILSQSDALLLKQCESAIAQLGFRFSIDEADKLRITGVPAGRPLQDTQVLFESILEQYKTYQTEGAEIEERWARAWAKRAALKHGTPLTPGEIDSLVDQLFACSNSKLAPDNMPIWRVVPHQILGDLLHE